MLQIPLPLKGLPLHLVLLQNGCVAFTRVANFSAILDNYEDDKVIASLYFDVFYLSKNGDTQEFSYDTMYAYKEIPLMLEWLQSLELEEPKWNMMFM